MNATDPSRGAPSRGAPSHGEPSHSEQSHGDPGVRIRRQGGEDVAIASRIKGANGGRDQA